ncbi:HIV TAT specific factor 1 [Aphelenchoides bicaudatus]|nr:HIV TAT specific factor 1 [Aphelenchoides bicaudatus]
MAESIEDLMAKASEEQRYGATPTASDNEEEDEPTEVEQPKQNVPPRRYIDGRWIFHRGEDKFLEYINNEWKPVSPDTNIAELKQKWEEADSGPTIIVFVHHFQFFRLNSMLPQNKRVVNGVTMVWNEFGKTWIPEVDVDEDFLASYHAQYGGKLVLINIKINQFPTDYSQIKAPEPEPQEAPLTKSQKRAKKRQAAAEEAERLKGWIQMDADRNTKVYVSGLPKTITEEEYIELMSKYGVIMNDPRTNKPKVRLYKDNAGNLKGDGICCYVKVESVYLALQLLDEMRYDPEHTIHVERAHFEMKGEFDPKKKKARLTAAQKKRFLEKQEKTFEWKPDKDRGYRPVSDCTVTLKNMFTLDEVDRNAALILDLKEEMKQLYSKFGELKSVVVYDTNPEGVITLTYENVEASDLAVKSLNNIIRHGRQISASLWDGKEKFKREETEEERRRRESAWEEFLGNEEEHET